jgi:uncharacterized membrane protein
MPSVSSAIALSLAAVASAVALWVTWRRLLGADPVRRTLLVVLRALALLCVLAMLANPLSQRTHATLSAPRIVVLADRSASMALRDAPGGFPRCDWVRAMLEPAHPVGAALARADAHCLAFAEATVAAQLPLSCVPDGASTNLDAALRGAVRASPAGAPDAVLLLTDGAANRGPEREATLAWLASTRVPVYCVGVGSTERPPDVWVVRVDAPKAVRANTACPVSVTVASRSVAAGTARLTLSGEGVPTRETTVALAAGKHSSAHFALRLGRPGVYRCRVALASVPGEWTGANNDSTFFLRVTPGERKLLFVAGRPSTELKFILRAFEPLADTRVTCLVRKSGEGFAPIGAPLASRRLPAGRELSAFDAALLQNVPASALSGAELSGLVSFVGDRGGGLGVLGGTDSFASGGYTSTALPAVLGVRLQDGQPYSSVPVKAARSADAAALPPAADIERHEGFPGWSAMPLLGGRNPVDGVRPGASVLLRTDQGAPLLTVQRYGQGRTLCLLTGGTHRWVLSRDATETSRRGHGAFWRTIAAWLTTPPNRTPVALETDRDAYEVGQTARLVAQVTDEGFRPLSSARVVVAGTGGAREVQLAETAGSPGRYEGGLPLTAPGPIRLTATATLRGARIGADTHEIAVEPSSLELAEPAQDVAFLRALADASGGTYVPAQQAERLPQLLDLAPRARQVTTHLARARSAWALAALLALLTCDWLLRRWWGLG